MEIGITRLGLLKQVRKERRPDIRCGYDIPEILEAMSRYAKVYHEDQSKKKQNDR